jgi:Short C-terminal domain
MNELIADELAKLAQLRDQKVLTEEEFNARKALLLARKPSSLVPTGLRAWFGCLGAFLLLMLIFQISAIFRGDCVPPPVSKPQPRPSRLPMTPESWLTS